MEVSLFNYSDYTYVVFTCKVLILLDAVIENQYVCFITTIYNDFDYYNSLDQ